MLVWSMLAPKLRVRRGATAGIVRNVMKNVTLHTHTKCSVWWSSPWPPLSPTLCSQPWYINVWARHTSTIAISPLKTAAHSLYSFCSKLICSLSKIGVLLILYKLPRNWFMFLVCGQFLHIIRGVRCNLAAIRGCGHNLVMKLYRVAAPASWLMGRPSLHGKGKVALADRRYRII